MKRLSLNAWNDWRWVSRSYVDVTWFRINSDYLRGHFISVDFVLLGFGFSLSYYPNGKGAVVGISIDPEPGQRAFTVKWEPIEHDGCAGVPEHGMESGREHGA
jgi:hypothetical protein